ncbi:unnamed protein product, partial [Clonostachys rosea f. rosea IK726]
MFTCCEANGAGGENHGAGQRQCGALAGIPEPLDERQCAPDEPHSFWIPVTRCDALRGVFYLTDGAPCLGDSNKLASPIVQDTVELIPLADWLEKEKTCINAMCRKNKNKETCGYGIFYARKVWAKIRATYQSRRDGCLGGLDASPGRQAGKTLTIYLASGWMDLTNQSAVGSATSHIQTELYLLG